MGQQKMHTLILSTRSPPPLLPGIPPLYRHTPYCLKLVFCCKFPIYHSKPEPNPCWEDGTIWDKGSGAIIQPPQPSASSTTSGMLYTPINTSSQHFHSQSYHSRSYHSRSFHSQSYHSRSFHSRSYHSRSFHSQSYHSRSFHVTMVGLEPGTPGSVVQCFTHLARTRADAVRGEGSRDS